MTTNFKEDGDDVILNGAKMWISNAPFADIAVVWAKNEYGRIGALLWSAAWKGSARRPCTAVEPACF